MGPFEYNYRPTPDQIMQSNAMRERYKELHEFIISSLVLSRERSLALTELESSAHWVNKAIMHTSEG